MRKTSLRRLAGALSLLASTLWAAPTLAGTISVDYAGQTGDQITAVLSVTGLALFEAGDFTFSYDASRLSLQDVALGSLTGGFTILAGPPVPQVPGPVADVIVSLITGGASPIGGDGTLFTARFVLTTATGPTMPALGLSFDEISFGYSLDAAQLTLAADTPHGVPVVNTGALVLAGLLALAVAGGRRTRGTVPASA